MTAQAFSVTIRRAASRTTCLRAMTEEAFPAMISALSRAA